MSTHRNKKNIDINIHDLFHDMLSEADRLDFIIAEVSNLNIKDQAQIVIESFGDLQDYFDKKKMCAEVLDYGDDDNPIDTNLVA